MKPNERLHTTATALAQKDPTNILDPNEVAKIASDTSIHEDKLIGIMLYTKARLVEKLSKAKAFEVAYPERCVATREDASAKFGTTAVLGERLHRSTIDVKARRLEASNDYKTVWTILQTSLYVSYATDRLLVLDEALRKSLDPNVADREKPQYMKLFLEETRKPAEAIKMEMTMNVTQNNVSVVDIEGRMTDIAKQMENASAADIIEAVYHDNRES